MINYMPYTNFQDTNLDWILAQIQSIPDLVKTEVEKNINNVFAYASYDAETETLILRTPQEVIREVSEWITSSRSQ